jgi:PAS domain S-box-containing protein
MFATKEESPEQLSQLFSDDSFFYQPNEEEQLSAEQLDRVAKKAKERLTSHFKEVSRRADLIFGWLMVLQFVGGIVAALFISPYTWTGSASTVHVHVWAAILLGGMICLVPAAMAFIEPGAAINRYVISTAQMLYSALLIHLTGGRIETHFHIFGVLAFIALYRDWKVLIPATVMVALDLVARGVFWPESVFGVAVVESWRWIEHGAWVAFEVSILSFACIQAKHEMKEMAQQWAQLQINKQVIESEVDRQTREIWDVQSAVRASEMKLRSVINSANDAFISMDECGRIAEWSERAQEVFEWAAEEVLLKEFTLILGATSPCQLFGDGEHSSKEVRRTRFECSARTKSGKEIPVEVSVATSDNAGKPIFNIFVHDISSRKAMQSRLLHAEKLEGIGQLAAGIAHEINTPTQFTSDNLSFIESAFDGIKQLLNEVDDIRGSTAPDSADPSTWIAYEEKFRDVDLPYLMEELPLAIAQSKDGVRRIAEITSAMKSFSHPGAGGEKSPVDLTRAIQDAATVCRNEWKHVAEMTFELDPDLSAVPAYPGELNQVLLNLIVNAGHAIGGNSGSIHSNGRIVISTHKSDGWAVIRVQDNGPGIPDSIKSKIFDPFFTTKPVGKGTGQGLAIVHSVIVEKHGGEIDVESEIGKGAAFILRLPLTAPSNSDEEFIGYEEAHSIR